MLLDAIELIWGQVHLYVCISLQLVSSVTGNKSCVSMQHCRVQRPAVPLTGALHASHL